MTGRSGSASPCACYDAFQADLAGVMEDGLAVVAFQMLVEANAGIDASVALRTSSGSQRRSSPFKSIQIEGVSNYQATADLRAALDP